MSRKMTVYKNQNVAKKLTLCNQQHFDETTDDTDEDSQVMKADDSSTSETEDSEDQSSEEEHINRPATEDDDEMIVSSSQSSPPPQQFAMNGNLETCSFEEKNEEELIKALDSIMLYQSRVFHNIIHEVGNVLSQIQPGRWDSEIIQIHEQFMAMEREAEYRK